MLLPAPCVSNDVYSKGDVKVFRGHSAHVTNVRFTAEDKYVLTVVDAFSRWGEIEVLKDKPAETVADASLSSLTT